MKEQNNKIKYSFSENRKGNNSNRPGDKNKDLTRLNERSTRQRKPLRCSSENIVKIIRGPVRIGMFVKTFFYCKEILFKTSRKTVSLNF